MSIAMLIVGLIVLIAGKIAITKKVRIEGTRARVFGIILIAPWPLAFVVGMVLGMAGVVDEAAMQSRESVDLVTVVSGAITWTFLVGAFVYAFVTRPRSSAPVAVEDEQKAAA